MMVSYSYYRLTHYKEELFLKTAQYDVYKQLHRRVSSELIGSS